MEPNRKVRSDSAKRSRRKVPDFNASRVVNSPSESKLVSEAWPKGNGYHRRVVNHVLRVVLEDKY